MKKLFFVAKCMIVGPFLQAGLGFALSTDQGNLILKRIEVKEYYTLGEYNLEDSGPTAEDIAASTYKVENLAAKGSCEDKLIDAAKNGDLKNVETFIAGGTDLEARDAGDRTALMRAAEKGYTAIASKLINAGAKVDAEDRYGCTPLFMASNKNHSDTVAVLVAAGAANDRNFADSFVQAVSQGDIKMVKALISEDAKIDCDIVKKAYSMVSDYRNTELLAILKHLKSRCNSSRIND